MVGEKGRLTPRVNMGNISPSGGSPAGGELWEAITPCSTKYPKKSPPFLGELSEERCVFVLI